MMNLFVTRFAPSPTGYLHLGHAFSALSAYEAARGAGGRFHLRIEDIDRGRCRPEFESAITDDLSWLGLTWEEPVRRQSDHFADYDKTLTRLIAAGLVYRCFKTRKEVLNEIARAPHFTPQGPEGPAYVGGPLPQKEEEALIGSNTPYAWRLSISAARQHLGGAFDTLAFIVENRAGQRTEKAKPELFGDVVIARKDSGTSYHLASVHDDGLQGITHVIRGEDLATAAHLHTLLQALLNLPAPIYRHHRLMTDKNGRRLAKRDRAATLRAMREAGETPASVRTMLGF